GKHIRCSGVLFLLRSKDPCGSAPLHLACRFPPTAGHGADPVDPSVSLRVEVVALLLRAGAAPSAVDAAGRRPVAPRGPDLRRFGRDERSAVEVALVPGFCAASVPACDRLRAMLLAAERQWRRRSLAVLRAQLQRGRSERSNACLDCLGGDEAKCILEFL
ncbi:unnamed protein product, partial [Prorocentrum cordatum]